MYSPLVSVISVKKDEVAIYNDLLEKSLFPSRVSLYAYEHDRDSFPINVLRNLAYKNTETTHVLMTDIDVFPDGIVHHYPIIPSFVVFVLFVTSCIAS